MALHLPQLSDVNDSDCQMPVQCSLLPSRSSDGREKCVGNVYALCTFRLPGTSIES